MQRFRMTGVQLQHLSIRFGRLLRSNLVKNVRQMQVAGDNTWG